MKTLSKDRIALFVGAVSVGVLLLAPSPKSQAPSPSGTWFKGNLHTHTLNSDGDSTPDEVAKWYRDRGYHFVTMTDHNKITDVNALNATYGKGGKFLVMKGEEVTGTVADKPIHINAFEPEVFVNPVGGASVVAAMQQVVDAIRAAKGVPSINHPNFGWAFSTAELQQLQRTRLFEVFNGHPTVNNLGGGGVPGLEEVWDRILSSGKLLYGIAVDDAHFFKQPENDGVPKPGRGWVYVQAARLESRALLDALERGDFYSSTGVELASITKTASSLSVAIKPMATRKYRIQFIGRNGAVLSESPDISATYTFKGNESYVRAKVLDSNGKAAWVQPIGVGAKPPR